MVVDSGEPDEDDELLREWEQRISRAGDPADALAELLGGRDRSRQRLYSLAGESFLGCRLQRILGAGGMGVTYAAQDREGRAVAVKLVPALVGAMRERFEQECRMLQQLDHPAIVRYRDHEITDEDVGVLAMDLVAGLDLEQLLEELHRDVPPDELHPMVQFLLQEVSGGVDERIRSPRLARRLLRMLADVADGLHAAHESGVVHRDVKPANIRITERLAPVLIDFGLARDGMNRVSFTQSGAAMGTLAYMAPEQLGRDPGAVDRRADVYALGLVLYRAFVGIELREAVGDVVRGSRPFLLSSSQTKSLPSNVQAILYSCLDPNPARRYRTAKDLADDLRAASGQGVLAARIPPFVVRFVRDRRRVAALSFASLLLVLLLVWGLWPRGRWVTIDANVEVPLVLTVDGSIKLAKGGRVWLPYGDHEVHIADEQFRPRLHLIRVPAGDGDHRQYLLVIDRETIGPESLRLPGQPAIQFMTGHSRQQGEVGVARDQLWIDDVLQKNNQAAYWETGEVQPGLRLFRARDGKGREEAQLLLLGEGPVDVQLLPAVMFQIDGAFRRTLSTVLSPRPDDLTIEGEHTPWMGGLQPPALGTSLMQADCALTAPVADRWVAVTVRCAFPEPMRSAVVYMQNEVASAGQLEILAGFEGEELRAWPRTADGSLQDYSAFSSASGARALRIEARMRTDLEVAPGSVQVGFLSGTLFGGHWNDAPPCLAIVADPGDRAKLPERVVPDVESQPPIAPVEFVAIDGVESTDRVVAVHPLDADSGERNVLVTVDPGSSKPSRIERRSLPGWVGDEVLRAADMHPRSAGQLDGTTFGTGVVALGSQASGWSLIVGDGTSASRGAANGGLLARMDWQRREPVWIWPEASFRSNATQGDDTFGLFPMACGDWNGDGRVDVVASARNYWSSPASEQVGLVDVLDAERGSRLFRRVGLRLHGRLSCLDAWPRRGSGPATLLLQSVHRVPEVDHATSTSWSLWSGGVSGSESKPLAAPVGSHAVLVGQGAGHAVSVLLVTPRGSLELPSGIRRYELEAGALVLRAEQRLDFAGLVGDLSRFSVAVTRIGDRDRDGYTDVAFLIPARGRESAVLLVSAKDGKVLGYGRLPRPATGDPVWLPAAGGLSGRLWIPAGQGLMQVGLR